jgi:antitoxin PrlF
MSTTVTSKGQATIPKPIRELLGLVDGDRVDYVVVNGKVELQKARPESPAARYAKVRHLLGRRGLGIPDGSTREVRKKVIAESIRAKHGRRPR